MRHPAWSHLVNWVMVVSLTTIGVVVLGGTAVWRLEYDHPGSNLRSWGDSVWWSITTITTTGYGEHYPVTLWGRAIAVVIMVSGVAIIGAVAAIVAFGFAGRLAQRLEEAVSHVENQVEHAEAEDDATEEHVGRGRPGRPRRPAPGLRALTIGVADAESADSLTWLLARLGWHPTADGTGIAWGQGGVLLRIAVRPWDVGGIQGRLTFAAGSPERLERIAREATRHGFRRVTSRPAGGTNAGTSAGATPAARAKAARALADGEQETVEGSPAVLRTTRGFEVMLVTS